MRGQQGHPTLRTCEFQLTSLAVSFCFGLICELLGRFQHDKESHLLVLASEQRVPSQDKSKAASLKKQAEKPGRALRGEPGLDPNQSSQAAGAAVWTAPSKTAACGQRACGRPVGGRTRRGGLT